VRRLTFDQHKKGLIKPVAIHQTQVSTLCSCFTYMYLFLCVHALLPMTPRVFCLLFFGLFALLFPFESALAIWFLQCLLFPQSMCARALIL
jgi:hypothetical protein